MMHIKSSQAWLWLFTFALGATSLVACGEDEEGGGSSTPGSIRVSVNPAMTEVGGSPINVTVTAFTTDNKPMPPGTVVDVGELAKFTGDANGVLGWFGGGEATDANRGATSGTITTITGSFSVSFRCEKAGTTTLVTAFRAAPNLQNSTQVTCNPGPAGDWTVSTLSLNEGQLRVGGNPVKIAAAVVDGAGAPVAAGVPIKFTVESGESLAFASGTPTATANTDAEGVAIVNMKTSATDEGDTVVRAEFVDARYGTGASETFKVRPQGGAEQTTVEFTVKRNGAVLGPNDLRVLADGEDFVTVEAQVVLPDSASGVALQGRTMDFALTGAGFMTEGANDDSERLALTKSLDSNGKASVRFFGGDTAGGGNITVSLVNPDPDSDGGTLTESVTITVTALGFIEIIGANPNVLYVRGSGQNQSTTVTFSVQDTNRQILAGVPVTFELRNSPSGTTLGAMMATTNERGRVETTVQSGTSTGAFSVTAIARLGSSVLEASSNPIPIIGALPNRNGMTLQCEHRNIGGFIGRQGTAVNVDAQFDCRSVLVDRFGNRVGVEQRVTYASEGGNIVSPQTSKKWDTAQSPQQPPADVGTVSAPYSPGGQPPCDVDNMDGEPWWEDGDDCNTISQGCAARADSAGACRFNPRDGLVTVIAVTRGEEAFSDINQNGSYDEGEPFWDIGEPFVDTNDNNTHDQGETFTDLAPEGQAQGNQAYDPPNGRWDGTTSIWLPTHVLLTGDPYQASENDIADMEPAPDPFAIGYAFSSDPLEPYPTAPVGADFTTVISKWWHDKNLNNLNHTARYTARLIGNPAGVTLTHAVVGVEGDTFGFLIDYIEENITGSINRYATEIEFDEGSFPGTISVATLVPGLGSPTNVTVEFEVTYAVAMGQGTPITFKTQRNVRIIR